MNYNGAPLRDRVTRGGPAVLGNTQLRASWFYFGTDGRKSLSFDYNGYHEADGKGTTRHNIGPIRQLAADARAVVDLRPASATTSTTTMRSGWRTRKRTASRRATCSAA